MHTGKLLFKNKDRQFKWPSVEPGATCWGWGGGVDGGGAATQTFLGYACASGTSEKTPKLSGP